MSGTKVVITTFKNEAPYILEWVAHYRSLGFDQIVVYTNDCTDGTNELLQRLEELGEVIFRENQVGTGGIHRSALRQAKRLEAVQNAEWLFVCDIDEYLNIHVGDHTINALIDATGPGVDAISIPWKIFSNNGRSILRNELVTTQFTECELPPVEGGATRRFVKTIFRPSDKVERIGLHGPVLREEHKHDFTWAVPGGARVTQESLGGHVTAPFGYDTAQLNHYAVRSVESYMLKKHRGRANHMSHSLDTGYWDRWNRGGSEDLSFQRYVPQIQKRMGIYKSDEVLNRHHRDGFRWHKELAVSLRDQEEYAELRQQCENRLTLEAPPKERPAPPLRPAMPLAEAQSAARGAKQMPVGSLWIGQSLSYVEQMCLLSFVRQGHPVTLFTYGPVRNVPEDIILADARDIHDPDSFLYSKFGTPVGQSDIFRLHMIQKTGLLWADADVVCLKPIEADDGHVHGIFKGTSVCNALLRLPPESEALKRYMDYVADPHPIPPWWDAEKQAEAQAQKQSGNWKHASEQSHDIYGPPALTHFLNETGEIRYSRPADHYYPVPFKGLDAAIEPGDLAQSHFTDNTRAVHLWARRLRWRLPGLGLQKGSFIYDQLEQLEINPKIAPLLAEEEEPDLWAPAHSLPRSCTKEEIIDTAPIPLTDGQIAVLEQPQMDGAIRMAENVLRVADAENRYGFHDPLPNGRKRGIDAYGTGAMGAFVMAQSILNYAKHHDVLPDLLAPRGAIEKLTIWKHFGAMPIPSPADRLTAESFVPEGLRDQLLTPTVPWLSTLPVLPKNGEIPDVGYELKASHKSGTARLDYPLNSDEYLQFCAGAQQVLADDKSFFSGLWWLSDIPRRVFLERSITPVGKPVLPEWKFWTIGGQVVLTQVDLLSKEGPVQRLHDRDGKLMNEPFFQPAGPAGPTPPEAYSKMVALAEAIGAELEFARVAISEADGKLVLRDISLCPEPECRRIQSRWANRMLSDAWDKTAILGEGRQDRAA